MPAWRFWPQYAADLVIRHIRIGSMAARLLMVRHRLKRDKAARDYRDLALTQVGDEDALELLTVTDAARRAAGAKLRPLANAR